MSLLRVFDLFLFKVLYFSFSFNLTTWGDWLRLITRAFRGIFWMNRISLTNKAFLIWHEVCQVFKFWRLNFFLLSLFFWSRLGVCFHKVLIFWPFQNQLIFLRNFFLLFKSQLLFCLKLSNFFKFYISITDFTSERLIIRIVFTILGFILICIWWGHLDFAEHV